MDRDYAELPQIDAEKEKEYLRNRLKIQGILTAEALQPAQEQIVEDYYRNYALARWTFRDRQNRVADYMNELKNELDRSYSPNRSNPGHAKLVEEVFRYMTIYTDPKTLANPKFDFAPTVRFNAILMLGELNQEESNGTRPPKPLAKALPILIDRARDPQQIDAVRIGALIGIRRHCRLMEKNAPVPNEVLRLLVDLVRAKESERVRSEEGHAWMRLLAIQTFADLQGRPKPAAVTQEILSVLAETESPEFLRYGAAEALGSLDYRNPAGLDMKVMLQALGLLTIEVCDQERQRLRDELESKKIPAPGGYGGYGGDLAGSMPGSMPSSMSGSMPSTSDMMMEMSGSGSGDPYGYGAMAPSATSTKEDRQIERVRRRLKEGMTAALVGMGKKRKTLAQKEEATGISVLAGTDAVKKQYVDGFSNPIHDFFGTIDKKEDDKQIQAKALDTAIADLRTALETALTDVGGTVPPSPEFEPLPEPKPLGGGYGSDAYGSGGYGSGSGGMP